MIGTLIIYKAKGKSSSTQLSRALNGYKDHSNKGKYLYYRKGLLKKIPYIKLMRGVFIVKKEDAERFVSLLKRYKVEHHEREVILTSRDMGKLGLV